MAEPDQGEDMEGLAAEFVLGTLTPDERLDVIHRMRTEPEMKRAVEAWSERLHPLIEGLEPVDPSPSLEERLLSRIGGLGQETKIVELQRAVKRWRLSAIALGTAAAALAAIVVVLAPGAIEPTTTGGHFVATLQAQGTGPAFVATVDVDRGVIAIRRVEAPAPSGKSYELWAIGGGRQSPQSLGLIDASLSVPADKLGTLEASALADTIFAVTVEPEGGSPSGQPSGPPVYVGKLIATE